MSAKNLFRPKICLIILARYIEKEKEDVDKDFKPIVHANRWKEMRKDTFDECFGEGRHE